MDNLIGTKCNIVQLFTFILLSICTFNFMSCVICKSFIISGTREDSVSDGDEGFDEENISAALLTKLKKSKVCNYGKNKILSWIC